MPISKSSRHFDIKACQVHVASSQINDTNCWIPITFTWILSVNSTNDPTAKLLKYQVVELSGTGTVSYVMVLKVLL